MKRIALFAALAIAACTPDIAQDPPQDHVSVRFEPAASPPVVPAPNDLAINPTTGRVDAPIDPASSAANQEFIRDYLNTLDGFPEGTPASASIAGGDLDPSTITPVTVMVNDLTVAQAGGAPPVAGALRSYDAASHTLAIAPPGGAWIKGHRYEVVVVGGTDGVKAVGGGQVFGSPTWALARSATSLVSCTDLASPDCRSVTSLATDAQAVQLEQLRRGYAPLLDALGGQGIPRASVAALWTFTIQTSPEVTFDPSAQVIPFPSDLVLGPDGGVAIPLPAGSVLADGGLSSTGQLYAGLNTLDGFSTTSPIVSENSDDLEALTDGAKIDRTTLATSTGFIPLTPVQIPPAVTIGLNLRTSALEADGGLAPLPDGGLVPEQLQFVPEQPLQERSQYAAWVTTGLKAVGGANVVPTTAFALFRLANPLLDASGHSTVAGVTDAQAQQIEPARAALKPLFDALAAQGLPRASLALAWTIKTQTEQTALDQLHGVPAQIPGLTPDPITLANADARLLTCGGSCPYPVTDLGHAFVGTILDPLLITGPGGTLNPTAPAVRPIPFTLTLPSSAPPAGGYPVVIFGHGLGGYRDQAMAIANSLALGGFAMIAIDEVFHGERSSCTGVGAYLISLGLVPAGTPAATADRAACADPTIEKCDEGFPIGRCIVANGTGNSCTYLSPTALAGTGGDLYCNSVSEGACKPTATGAPGPSSCEKGDFARTASGAVRISGWNIFNVNNLFATRDNLRQQVVDDAQLAATLQSTGATSLNAQLQAALSSATPLLDGTRLHYVGQSLGGILGTLYVSAAPEVHHAVLNVPAGDLLGVFLTTPDPTLGGLRTAFLAQLSAQGIASGTPAFDDFLGIARWILDPADPLNAAQGLTHGPAPADRHAFIQYVQGDQVLPNPTTRELIAAAIRADAAQQSCADGQPAPCVDRFEFVEGASSYSMPPAANRHGFLLNNASPTLTAKGQAQAVQYLLAGTVQAAP